MRGRSSLRLMNEQSSQDRATDSLMLPTTTHMKKLSREHVYIKLPSRRLLAGGQEYFLAHGLQPEICFEAPQVERLTPEDIRPFADGLRSRGLGCTVHAPFLDLDFGSSDTRIRNEAQLALERTMRLVEVLQPRSVVLHGGQPVHMTSAEYVPWNERALPLMAWTAHTALNLGSQVMLENICHTRPEQLAPLLDALDCVAGWCLDAGHMHVFGKVSMEQWVETLGQHLGQMHLHDNDGASDLHQGVGRGSIDFARLFAAIMDRFPHMPQPVTTLEVHYEKEVESSLDALQPLWPWD